MRLWRPLLSILVLPGTVTVFVPAWVLLGGADTAVGWGLSGVAAALPVLVGLALIAAGLVLMARTIALFATEGEGTLAPWDPPRRLVVRGVYRHVRNPMISGVLCVLLGEATCFGTPALFTWFALFFLANAVYIPLVEEPGLLERFGDDYRRYRGNVPRWIPRRRPWEGAS
jgi:protein-S-isoprenylcysteine O-methyltransferase Ste14